VKFWDSSALLPLIVEEERSRACRDLARADPLRFVWTLARVEVWGACCRKRREGLLSADQQRKARARLDRLSVGWYEVEDVPAVKSEADRLLGRYELRAADALQLGAALVACAGKPMGHSFVALDVKLLDAAKAEGLGAIEPK
jgi:predicted nucleic acid-binding protein